MQLYIKALFILLPFIAMNIVWKRVDNGIYLNENLENHPVLMYLDLTMYVMIAFVIATFLYNMVNYKHTHNKSEFTPTIFITCCTIIVTIFNLFIYETDIEKENKILMTTALQQFQNIDGLKEQKASLLEGYWIYRDEKNDVRSISYYDGGGTESVYTRDDHFSKVKNSYPYTVHFKNNIGYLTFEMYGSKHEYYMRFQDTNTLILMANMNKGNVKAKLKTIRIEPTPFYLERISKEQFEQYKVESKGNEEL